MNFSVYGPFSGKTGYDVLSRSFIKSWFNSGNNMKLHEFTGWSNTRGKTDIDDIGGVYGK